MDAAQLCRAPMSAALLMTYTLRMPRLARLDAPLALQHVWDRGIERGAIFHDDTDRLDFLARIEQLVQAQHCAVYAWALMANHFHLLICTGNLGVSASMPRNYVPIPSSR
jgi:REP-associated tyrosine transposase